MVWWTSHISWDYYSGSTDNRVHDCKSLNNVKIISKINADNVDKTSAVTGGMYTIQDA